MNGIMINLNNGWYYGVLILYARHCYKFFQQTLLDTSIMCYQSYFTNKKFDMQWVKGLSQITQLVNCRVRLQLWGLNLRNKPGVLNHISASICLDSTTFETDKLSGELTNFKGHITFIYHLFLLMSINAKWDKLSLILKYWVVRTSKNGTLPSQLWDIKQRILLL